MRIKIKQKERKKKYRTQVSSVHDLPFMLLLVALRREIFINHRLLVPSFITTSMAFFNKTISLAMQPVSFRTNLSTKVIKIFFLFFGSFAE